MAVTEFALIKLRQDYNHLDLVQGLKECQDSQDKWVRQNQPHGLDNCSGNLSTMYIQQHADTAYLLITAPWASCDAHAQWIQSDENKLGFGKMSDFIAPGQDSVLLFHMEPAGVQQQLTGQLVPGETLNLCRISVEAGKRSALQGKYHELEGDLRELGRDQQVWAGWRIETTDETQDMVVLSGTALSEEQLQPLTSLSDQIDRRCFKHVA